jgi:hypothetical protein
MNSKTVLNKIMQMLSLTEEVALTYAKLADGTIVESATFDVGEELFVVSEDGTKTPAPNGFHDLMLKDTEGNETLLKVKSEDGKIVERENVEMADVDAEKIKTQPIPSVGNEDKENVFPDSKGQVKDGTQMAEVTEDVAPLPEDTESEDEAGDDSEVEINLGDLSKKLEEMSYRIEEMAARVMKCEEAMYPPVDSEVTEEVAGVKMAAEPDEEELPKLDGAPVEDAEKIHKFNTNRKNYGEKLVDSQSSFLSKLYK